MDVVVERCAGLDVHKASVTGCVRFPGARGRRKSEQARFGTTTRELHELSAWLTDFGVTEVVMEATGVYWKPIFYRLEDDGFDPKVVNAAHVKNVPGRKTDRADAEWLAKLAEHGLLRASFVPPPDIRQLRDLTRYRKTQSNERTRVAQRIEKVLQDAGLKLSSVASNILGVSGRAMLEALAAGERDPEVLADMAKGRLRPKIGELTEALTSRIGDHHGVMLAEMLAHLDDLERAIERISAEIRRVIAPHEWAVELLDTIPGVNRIGAEIIIAEIGVDMTRFPTAAHLASWAGMCPGNNESAGKQPVRANPSWFNVAAYAAGRVSQRRGPIQGLLPRSPIPADRVPARSSTCCRRCRAHHPRGVLASAVEAGTV